MLRRIFPKYRGAKLYLGVVAVMPRTDIKRYFDEWGILDRADLDTELRASLNQALDLPSASDITNPTDSDIGIDILVPRFQSGDALSVDLGEIGFPLMWRPKVEVASRLYSLKTGRTLDTFSSSAKLRWRPYFLRLFSWRYLFGLRPMFDASDMELLLYQACYQLLTKMRKAL